MARKRYCANKHSGHRYHDWTEWVLTEKIKVYKELNPPRDFLGHELHLARRCNKCGLPDTMTERTY